MTDINSFSLFQVLQSQHFWGKIVFKKNGEESGTKILVKVVF